MLTLTENASTIVKDIASRTGGVEGAGLRSPLPRLMLSLPDTLVHDGADRRRQES